jgi:pilus assembly protein Flp/PilA
MAIRAQVARQDEGATAVEYALMIGLVAVVIVFAVTALGENLLDLFASAAAAFN